MIYGKLCDLPQYKGLCKNLDTAIEYLESIDMDLSRLKGEHIDVDGDNVFINCCSYTTVPREGQNFEAHRAYGDLQILRSGSEYMGVSPVSGLEELESHDDFAACSGRVDCLARLCPGMFCIVFPGDAHMLKIMDGAPCRAEKVVVKFKV
ncbi:MAG: YhcH/YjgK/YiaL family protein [Candidatus Limivicinus sp.]|jgi:YhcH/YjgK/YiaL family protein